mgnify:CR=1 FL=1
MGIMCSVVEELFRDIEKFGWKVVCDKVNYYKAKEQKAIVEASEKNINIYKDAIQQSKIS